MEMFTYHTFIRSYFSMALTRYYLMLFKLSCMLPKLHVFYGLK